MEPGRGRGVACFGGDGSFEQAGVGVQGEERGEDGRFEHVRADAFAGTGVVAIALGVEQAW